MKIGFNHTLQPTSLSTSSKFGQQSRLLVKVNYKDEGYIGDLDLKSVLESSADPLENISQVTLKIKDLLKALSDNKDLIESIEYEYNPELVCSMDKSSDFEDIIKSWSSKSGVKVKKLNL